MSAVAACDRVDGGAGVTKALEAEESLTRRIQRLVVPRLALAAEFKPQDISRDFPGNGTTDPDDDDYRRLAANGFRDWRLQIDGLVEKPLALSLADLRGRRARTQITRHDCVEGWSAIAKWTGAPLGALLDEARLKAEARYLVFYCADSLEATLDGSGRYYESIDLVDAYHPQTILAYAMNDRPLPVANGAPLRLRVERQLGYKQAKYVMRIEAVKSFAHLGRGRGGYWEDRGYEWYAGI